MKPRHHFRTFALPRLAFPRPAFMGLALTGLTLLASCGTTKPSRFYMLSRVPSPPDLMEHKGGPQVRLGAIELARYLSRPEIVTRKGENRIEAAEFDRWAADLQDLFSLTLSANLHILLPSEHVTRFPWELAYPDHFLTVSVGQFDVADGQAILLARWGLADGNNDIGAMHLSTFTEPVVGDGYEAIVAALSRTLADLSREIADEIRAEEKRQAGE